MKGHKKIKKNPKSLFYKTSHKSAVLKSVLSSSFHGFSSTRDITLSMISFVIASDYDAKVATLRFN